MQLIVYTYLVKHRSLNTGMHGLKCKSSHLPLSPTSHDIIEHFPNEHPDYTYIHAPWNSLSTHLHISVMVFGQWIDFRFQAIQ